MTEKIELKYTIKGTMPYSWQKQYWLSFCWCCKKFLSKYTGWMIWGDQVGKSDKCKSVVLNLIPTHSINFTHHFIMFMQTYCSFPFFLKSAWWEMDCYNCVSYKLLKNYYRSDHNKEYTILWFWCVKYSTLDIRSICSCFRIVSTAYRKCGRAH